MDHPAASAKLYQQGPVLRDYEDMVWNIYFLCEKDRMSTEGWEIGVSSFATTAFAADICVT